jgi:hypothetical protein
LGECDRQSSCRSPGDPGACFVAIGLVGSGAGRPINAIVRTGQVACFRSGECERERRLLTVATAKRPASTPQTSRHRRLVLAERERDKRGPALRQIVQSTSLPEVVHDFCFNSLRRLLVSASPRVEQADGGLGPRLPDPPIAEAWAAPIPPRVVSPIS